MDERSKLYFAIDEILWKDWDPIGVNDFEEARDEYQSYTPAIVSLLIKNEGADGIARKLYEIETEDMGLSGNFSHCLSVAKEIVNTLKPTR